MELLGFLGIRDVEKCLIEDRLSSMARLNLSGEVEESVISPRQIRRIKLPDAIIMAAAFVNRLELVTLDKALHLAWRELSKL